MDRNQYKIVNKTSRMLIFDLQMFTEGMYIACHGKCEFMVELGVEISGSIRIKVTLLS